MYMERLEKETERINRHGLKAGDHIWMYNIKTSHLPSGEATYEFFEGEYEMLPYNHYSNSRLIRCANVLDRRKQKELKYDEGVVFRSTVWLKENNRNKALELLQKDTANSRDDAKKIVDMFDKKISFIHHLIHYDNLH